SILPGCEGAGGAPAGESTRRVDEGCREDGRNDKERPAHLPLWHGPLPSHRRRRILSSGRAGKCRANPDRTRDAASFAVAGLAPRTDTRTGAVDPGTICSATGR